MNASDLMRTRKMDFEIVRILRKCSDLVLEGVVSPSSEPVVVSEFLGWAALTKIGMMVLPRDDPC